MLRLQGWQPVLASLTFSPWDNPAVGNTLRQPYVPPRN